MQLRKDSQVHFRSGILAWCCWLGTPKKGPSAFGSLSKQCQCRQGVEVSLICPTWWWGGRPTSFNILRAAASRHEQPLPTSLDAENFCLQAPSSRFLFPRIPLQRDHTASSPNSDSGLQSREAQEPKTEF